MNQPNYPQPWGRQVWPHRRFQLRAKNRSQSSSRGKKAAKHQEGNWNRSVVGKSISEVEWQVFSSQLPTVSGRMPPWNCGVAQHISSTLDFGVSPCGQVKRIMALTLQPLGKGWSFFCSISRKILDPSYWDYWGILKDKARCFLPRWRVKKKIKNNGVWTRKNKEIQPNKHMMGTWTF